MGKNFCTSFYSTNSVRNNVLSEKKFGVLRSTSAISFSFISIFFFWQILTPNVICQVGTVKRFRIKLHENIFPIFRNVACSQTCKLKDKNGFNGKSPDYSTHLIKEVKLFIYDNKECTFWTYVRFYNAPACFDYIYTTFREYLPKF